MEKSYNATSFDEQDVLKSKQNSIILEDSTCGNSRNPRKDLKFSPIIRLDEESKKSVFGRRMAMCKMRGESPLAKPTATVVECSETTVFTVSKNDEFESCYSSHEFTSSTIDCESSKYHFTPKQKQVRKAVNPFHTQLLDSIHLNTLSPSLFEPMPSPKDKENIWSIDERAILLPADITDEDIKMTTYSPDPVFEAKVHAGLELYWKSNAGYVPSPEGPRPIPVDSPADSFSDNPHHSSPNGRPPVARMKTIIKRNVNSQTDFTIPPSFSFDFQKILGDQYKYTGGDETLEEEFNVSTMNTSLPRKLFSEDESFTSQNDNSNDMIDENEFDYHQEGDFCDLDDDEVPSMRTAFSLDLSPIKKEAEEEEEEEEDE